MIIHHTGRNPSMNKGLNLTVLLDCGFTHNTDEGIKNTLKAKSPHLAEIIDHLYFGTFGSSDK